MQDNQRFNTSQQNADIALFTITPSHLDMFIGLLFTRNTNRSPKMLEALSRFLHYVNLAPYRNDIEFLARWFLLCRVLAYMLQDGLDAESSRLMITGTIYDEEIARAMTNLANGTDYSDDYLRVIMMYIDTRLRYIHLWEQSGRLYDLLLAIRSGTIDDIQSVCEETEEILLALYQKIRRRRHQSAHIEGYSIDNEIWMQKLRYERDMSLRPGMKIRSGVRLFNDMLNGGFERTRYHLMVMETGKGKSAFGLMQLFWSTMFNRDVMTNDPTKRPCVLYISHENLPGESLKREVSFLYGHDVDISKMDNEELAKCRILKDKLYGDPNAPGTMWYHVHYFPVNTVSPEDVDALIDETQANGFEVVGVINDYSKRMLCRQEWGGDERKRLGMIVDQSKAIANLRNIFWLDFMQVRRFVIEKLAEYTKNGGQLGAITQMQKTDVGESSLMADNADYVIAGTREQDPQGNRWMGFKLLKWRGMDPQVTSFYQPFYPNSGMRLVEDVEKPQPVGVVLADARGNIENTMTNTLRTGAASDLPEYAGPHGRQPHRYTPPRQPMAVDSPISFDD